MVLCQYYLISATSNIFRCSNSITDKPCMQPHVRMVAHKWWRRGMQCGLDCGTDVKAIITIVDVEQTCNRDRLTIVCKSKHRFLRDQLWAFKYTCHPNADLLHINLLYRFHVRFMTGARLPYLQEPICTCYFFVFTLSCWEHVSVRLTN